MTEPRVLLLLGASTGGIGTHVRDLASGLRALDVPVTIATHRSTIDSLDLTDALSVWPDRSAPRQTLRTLAGLRRMLRRYDVVHAHGHQAGWFAASLLGRRRTGPRLVISLHNELPRRGAPIGMAVRRLDTRALRRADLVTGASGDLVAHAQLAGARLTRLAKVPSPLVPALLAATTAEREQARERLRAELGLTPQAPVVLTISRIAPQKDLPTLLTAAAALPRDSDATWIVVGRGVPELLERLRDRVTAEGLAVRFLGAVPDPAAYLLGADAFALTSTWEARALVVQEAMAAGLPVVATDTGGLPDLVAGVGELAEVGDGRGIGAAISWLIADPDARATIGAAGRERAREWPDSAETARQWLRWYRELLGVAH